MDSNNNGNKETTESNSFYSDSLSLSSKSDSLSGIDEIAEPSPQIKEVYSNNLEEEMAKIKTLINEYNYIGMDTEFPGTIYKPKILTPDFYYKTIKANIESTKLIQLGLTLFNKNGEFPKNTEYHTWQFNFYFDEKKDKYSNSSINLLKKTGINFDNLKLNGINHKKFSDCFIKSGLVLNPKIKWISFHGAHDFAYLLKLLIKDNLPNTEKEFISLLKLYFPDFYDIKMLLKDNEIYTNQGLNKLINILDIERKGIMHQAGSDSIATIEAYFKLIENKAIDSNILKKWKNVLYGIGKGLDNNNTIKYLYNMNIDFNDITENKNKAPISKNNNINVNNFMINNQNRINYYNNINYGQCSYQLYCMNVYEMMKKNAMIMSQMKVCLPMNA